MLEVKRWMVGGWRVGVGERRVGWWLESGVVVGEWGLVKGEWGSGWILLDGFW